MHFHFVSYCSSGFAYAFQQPLAFVRPTIMVHLRLHTTSQKVQGGQIWRPNWPYNWSTLSYSPSSIIYIQILRNLSAEIWRRFIVCIHVFLKQQHDVNGTTIHSPENIRSSCHISIHEIRTTKVTVHHSTPYVYRKSVLKVTALPHVDCRVLLTTPLQWKMCLIREQNIIHKLCLFSQGIFQIVHSRRDLVNVLALFGCGRDRTIIVQSPSYPRSWKFYVLLHVSFAEQQPAHGLPYNDVDDHLLRLLVGRSQPLSNLCVHRKTCFDANLCRHSATAAPPWLKARGCCCEGTLVSIVTKVTIWSESVPCSICRTVSGQNAVLHHLA